LLSKHSGDRPTAPVRRSMSDKAWYQYLSREVNTPDFSLYTALEQSCTDELMETSVEKARRSWLRAHWKAVLIVWLAVVLSGAFLAFALISNSDVATLAVATAGSNPKIVERLGQPIKRGWFVSGSIEVTPGSGHAELAIPVSGPKGSGTLYAEARKRAGLWHLEILEFGRQDSSERLNLLTTNTASPTTPSQ
jgi:Cytochrome oxidase complex assembly protein 1